MPEGAFLSFDDLWLLCRSNTSSSVVTLKLSLVLFRVLADEVGAVTPNKDGFVHPEPKIMLHLRVGRPFNREVLHHYSREVIQ